MENNLYRILTKLSVPSVNFNVGNLEFNPSYIQAGLVVFLLFVMVILLARMRRIYLHWSLKGAASMIALGFFIALIMEGFMLIGGRTFMTEFLGWKNPPKPISKLLDSSRGKLVDVLGVKDEVPSSNANYTDASQFIDLFRGLTSQEADKVRQEICQP